MKIVFLEADSLGEDMKLDHFFEIGEVVVYGKTTVEQVPQRIAEADAVIVNKLPMNKETLSGAGFLKYIGLTATGVNNIDFDYTNKRGITVTNVAGYSTEVVAQHTFAMMFYLLEHLEHFHEAYPKIKVTVMNATTPETLHHLQDGRIDFGVVSTPMEPGKNLHVTPVRSNEDSFVAGRKFSYMQGGRLSYKELEKMPLMCLEGNTSTRRYVEQFLQEQRVHVTPEFELPTSDMLIQFAKRGLGVAGVVKDFALEGIASGELFQLVFDHPIPRREFCIVVDDRVPMTAAAGEMLDFLLT